MPRRPRGKIFMQCRRDHFIQPIGCATDVQNGNNHSGTTCHRTDTPNHPLNASKHGFPYLILQRDGKILRKNLLLPYNDLTQRRKTRLGNVKASDAQWDSNNRTTPKNPCNRSAKRQPKTGEDNPNQIQKSRPYSGCRRRDKFLPKWAKSKPRNPKTRYPERNADDRATPENPDQEPCQPEPNATEREPKKIADECHFQTTQIIVSRPMLQILNRNDFTSTTERPIVIHRSCAFRPKHNRPSFFDRQSFKRHCRHCVCNNEKNCGSSCMTVGVRSLHNLI